ncbi:MAG TPA: HPF/RaiA family ribosome-associated protein [Geminicoccus sp.]|jgi:ribosome-associated translation inhibitor RaiA|uniref:HPF/RaiA family ribosome-associated protein n=1 Tax=Geminicoccus sp. TaxID=2024832 RepID=UPI002E369F10|nr:HPF/RaiA family ribosome-associated protein [Geminicoccus sp.]HEX2529783.1 HPF/RaiA family ribosome-associated protein [Geminicoccus sp.]
MERQLQITYKGLESSPSLDAMIRERTERLERHHPHVIGCRVAVEVPHRSPDSGKTAIAVAVEVEVPGRNLIVGRSDTERREVKNDHTAVVNRAFDAAQRQLEDSVRTQRDHARHIDGGTLRTGQVVRIFPDAGYGFIEIVGSPDLHFTKDDVVSGGFDEIEVGAMVQVTPSPAEGPMGPRATEVRLFTKERAAS